MGKGPSEDAGPTHSNELTRQLIDAQLVLINSLELGPLETGLYIALMQVLRKLNSGSLIIPICVMDSIEDVVEEQGLNKKLAKHEHYSVKVDGHARAWMKHQKVQTIVTSYPAQDSDKTWLIKGYDSWEFYRETNLPLSESQKCLQIHQ